MSDPDAFGRSWPNVTESERCHHCGQPDNCGDCTHNPLTVDEVILLGGRVTDSEWDALPAQVRDRLDPGSQVSSP